MTDPFLSICAPAFNEEENIEKTVIGWLQMFKKNQFPGEVVITNDGSSDGTEFILRRVSETYPNLKVVTHKRNRGYGRALQSAISASTGEYVLTIDSDGQFSASEYEILLKKLKETEADLITGYRKKKKDTLFRVFADRILNRIVRLMFSVKLRDTNCALKLGKGNLMRSIAIEAAGFPAPTELTLKATFIGAKIGEAPVSHFPREGGISTLHPIKTGIRFLKFLFYLKWQFGLRKQGILF